jgi:hypothetical protein
MDRPETQAHQLKANRSNPASQAIPAMLVPQALPAHLEMPEKTAKLVNPDPKVQKARPDHPEPMVNPAHLALLAHLVHLAKRVFVRNIALWTAASSSRTERGDKRSSKTDILKIISRRILFFSNGQIGLRVLTIFCISFSIKKVPKTFQPTLV